MLDKMYTIMDAACEWGNKNLGTSIQFPKPTKKYMDPVLFQVELLVVLF